MTSASYPSDKYLKPLRLPKMSPVSIVGLRDANDLYHYVYVVSNHRGQTVEVIEDRAGNLTHCARYPWFAHRNVEAFGLSNDASSRCWLVAYISVKPVELKRWIAVGESVAEEPDVDGHELILRNADRAQCMYDFIAALSDIMIASGSTIEKDRYATIYHRSNTTTGPYVRRALASLVRDGRLIERAGFKTDRGFSQYQATETTPNPHTIGRTER